MKLSGPRRAPLHSGSLPKPLAGQSACGKALYRSKTDAEAHARIMRRRRDEALQVYRCPRCAPSGWHIGHPSDSW